MPNRGQGSSLTCWLCFCPCSQGKQVTFFAVRAHCGFSKLLLTRPPRSLSVPLPLRYFVPKPIILCKVIPPHWQDLAHAFAKLPKIPVSSFLQPAQIPLNGSIALQQLLPQAGQCLTQCAGPQERPLGLCSPTQASSSLP